MPTPTSIAAYAHIERDVCALVRAGGGILHPRNAEGNRSSRAVVRWMMLANAWRSLLRQHNDPLYDVLSEWVFQPDREAECVYIRRYSTSGDLMTFDGETLVPDPTTPTRIAPHGPSPEEIAAARRAVFGDE